MCHSQVDYYGTPTPLRQIAGISAPEASLLVVQPYDTSAIPAIEKAMMTSDIGITPSNDGKLIRLQIPQLTAVSERVRGLAWGVGRWVVWVGSVVVQSCSV